MSWLRGSQAQWLAILVLTCLAACDRPDGKWIIERIDDKADGLPRGAMHAEFVDGHFSADTGCNGLTGRYVALAGRIWFSHLKQHLVVCPGHVMEREELITSRFARASAFDRRTHGTLVLRTRPGQSITLRVAPS